MARTHGVNGHMLVSAYTASNARTANYDAFGPGSTGHAEAYHKDYLTLHPDQPYIGTYDLQTVGHRTRLFRKLYRAKPVLVGTKS